MHAIFLIKWVCVLCALFSFVCVSANAEETRVWVRKEDGREVKASLKAYDAGSGQVTLLLVNGKTAVIQADVLGDADREFLQAHERAREAVLEAAKEARLESFVPENAGGHKVHVYKPKGYVDGDLSNESRPIAFLYSPTGNSMSILDRLKPAADELGWLLVGVDAYRNTNSLQEGYEERLETTMAAFAAVSEKLIFDADKIVFGGMSGGGWWSYQSASKISTNVAGVMSFGGGMGNMHDQRYSKKMAVAMVNGDSDNAAIMYEERDGDFLRKRCSASVKVFRFQGGHVMAPAETALEAARWIHAEKNF